MLQHSTPGMGIVFLKCSNTQLNFCESIPPGRRRQEMIVNPNPMTGHSETPLDEII